jgi:hypothetical protein
MKTLKMMVRTGSPSVRVPYRQVRRRARHGTGLEANLGKARQGPPRSIRQGRHGTQVTIPDGIKSSYLANRTPVEAKAIKRGAQDEVDVWRRGMENDAGGSSAGCWLCVPRSQSKRASEVPNLSLGD